MTSPAPAFAVDRRGPGLLIRQPGEAEPAGLPTPVPGHAFVRVSAAAAAEPALVTALPALLHRHLVAGGEVRAVHVGVPDLGADALVSQALADALDVEIFAPVGNFCTRPGAALYAPGGWRRFRPGAAPSAGGHRHPVPPWEPGLPAEAVTAGGVVLEPVPAGVQVRGATEPAAAPGGPAFAIPADPAVARVVVGADGRVPPPAEVAAAVARLAEVPVQLVALPSAARTSAWLRDFAKTLGRDVLVAAVPDGEGSFGLFASLLRQRPDGGQEVAAAASPPGRWQRRGQTGYRLGMVQAEVVPSGLALHTGRPDPAAARPPADPHGWTLHLGTPGERLTPELLTAAEEVLGELTPQARAAARLVLAGELDDDARSLLSAQPRTAPGDGARAPESAAGENPRARRPRTAADPATGEIPRGERPNPLGSVRADGPAAAGPAVPGAASPLRGAAAGGGSRSTRPPAGAGSQQDATSAARRSVVPKVPRPAAVSEATVELPRPLLPSGPAASGSGAPQPSEPFRAAAGSGAAVGGSPPSGPVVTARSAAPQPAGPPRREAPAPVTSEAEAEAEAGAEAGAPPVDQPRPGPIAPPSLLVSGPPSATVAPAPPAETEPAAPREPEAEARKAPVAEPAAVVSGEELAVADRASTAAEQARFTAAAGDAYGEALATVNAALATWPSMRRQEAGAKADYVAVCLYLGSGAGGAADLGAAVRSGSAGELDGQLPCLVSGLRRLPTHRRAVLRQGRAGQPPEAAAAPGTVLVEPGFLVGSTDLDITVPDAGLDVLIWPASARRTAELRIGPAVNEVVFFAGARFKALAVRTVEAEGERPDDAVAAPRAAALFRELAPGEQASAELDERDLAALAKLDQALERRRRGALRVVDDPGVAARMTTSLLEWRADTAAKTGANHTATLAS
ncbi:hypothetical protein [Amycolatopsis sp. Hca4]|uniref:hypothetical protein n=1 Tax=Amycolatopsis sp. Hca4 TaxID=2742131 RepID=UPI00158FECBC|nr:hypothetical protein [Amycolatopsis sp. Hca4]QKV74012.1 hypothetical protein HUT10_09685 [Amycolatopsis sp. Hca4]